jgi:hypothetical protein
MFRRLNTPIGENQTEKSNSLCEKVKSAKRMKKGSPPRNRAFDWRLMMFFNVSESILPTADFKFSQNTAFS